MNFLRTRHEQLADHLRQQIRLGLLSDPLPTTRDWAGRLGVSCATLSTALHTLERERWLAIRPRQGLRLNPARPGIRAAAAVKRVRLLYRGLDFRELPSYIRWYGMLSQRLQPHGIELIIEKCSDARLLALARKRRSSDGEQQELLLFHSLPAAYQRRFERAGRAALIVGYRAPGISLPFVTFDMESAIRHAAHGLLRRGFVHLDLLINCVLDHAVQRQLGAFRSACADWPHQPVVGETVDVPLEAAAQLATLRRYALRAKGRRGLIIIGPVAVGSVMTALYAHGARLPEQIEIATIDGLPSVAVVVPMPVRYEASLEAFIKALTHAAVHFFQTGTVPGIDKTLPLQLVRSDAQ